MEVEKINKNVLLIVVAVTSPNHTRTIRGTTLGTKLDPGTVLVGPSSLQGPLTPYQPYKENE